jgi:hypothetical protein
MNYRFLKVHAKSTNPFNFSDKQNRPVYQKDGSRKIVHIEEVEKAFVITEKMDIKSTIQYFSMLSVDYLRACKYYKIVSQLEKNYRIMIEEP